MLLSNGHVMPCYLSYHFQNLFLAPNWSHWWIVKMQFINVQEYILAVIMNLDELKKVLRDFAKDFWTHNVVYLNCNSWFTQFPPELDQNIIITKFRLLNELTLLTSSVDYLSSAKSLSDNKELLGYLPHEGGKKRTKERNAETWS